MPKGKIRYLFGVFDPNVVKTLQTLVKSDSFPALLGATKLPKATLYKTLVKMLDSGLIAKVGRTFKVTTLGLLILDACERLEAQRKLEINDNDVERVLRRAERMLSLESLGYDRMEQFCDLLDLVENVKAVEVPA